MTRISVIIPAYNAEKYLSQCLDSLIGQDFRDWEGIVVDDGSTDSTADIAARYAAADPRIKLFRKENAGVSAARNFGKKKAVGQWITFIDSDDCLYPHSLSALISASAGVEMVAGGFFCGISQGAPEAKKKSGRVSSSPEVLLEMLYQTGTDVSVCGKLYSSALANSLDFRSGRRFEDLEYNIELLSSGNFKIRIISDIVYFYRTNPTSFINTFRPDRMDVLPVTEELEELLRNTPAEDAAHERRLSANFNIFSLLCVHDKDGHYATVMDGCWKFIKENRLACLKDSRTRWRSKVGAALSFSGRFLFSQIARIVYRGR